jgi:hypothetical protein
MNEDEEIAAVVSKNGWTSLSIYDASPRFRYSIGLMHTYDHPEFIIFGLEPRQSHAILAAIVRDIRGGGSFKTAGTHGGILIDDALIAVRPVHPSQHPLYFGYAMGFCRHIGRRGELQAVQVFWPDEAGRFPFDVGFDLDVYHCQSRLDFPLTPREIKEFE